jgi:hypothetical protein
MAQMQSQGGPPLPNAAQISGPILAHNATTLYARDPITQLATAQEQSAEAEKRIEADRKARFLFGGNKDAYGLGGFGISDGAYADDVRQKAQADAEAQSLSDYLKKGGALPANRLQPLPGDVK